MQSSHFLASKPKWAWRTIWKHTTIFSLGSKVGLMRGTSTKLAIHLWMCGCFWGSKTLNPPTSSMTSAQLHIQPSTMSTYPRPFLPPKNNVLSLSLAAASPSSTSMASFSSFTTFSCCSPSVTNAVLVASDIYT